MVDLGARGTERLPDQEIYDMAVRPLIVFDINETLLDLQTMEPIFERGALSALSRRLHTWDTLGAVAAGWEAALIKRVGNDVFGVGPQPHVADRLIARHKPRA
jgi:hypothetical protein